MKLNTTSQYAIRIMAFIAKQNHDKLFNAKNISNSLDIPYKYMTKIMTLLVEANIINSLRGREGGYSLAKDPVVIKIIDILEAVKECIHSKNCVLGEGLCSTTNKCSLHDSWRYPKKTMLGMFRDTTLADIV
jgi:Rrf2 family protein